MESAAPSRAATPTTARICVENAAAKVVTLDLSGMLGRRGLRTDDDTPSEEIAPRQKADGNFWDISKAGYYRRTVEDLFEGISNALDSPQIRVAFDEERGFPASVYENLSDRATDAFYDYTVSEFREGACDS